MDPILTKLEKTAATLDKVAAHAVVLDSTLKKTEKGYCDLQAQLSAATEKVDALQTERDEVWRDREQAHREILNLREMLAESREDCEKLRSAESACKKQTKLITDISVDMNNTIMDLQGRIRVHCRVRPLLPADKGAAGAGFVYPGALPYPWGENCIALPREHKEWRFDRVLPPPSTQEDVFTGIAPLVQAAQTSGKNVSVIAYGPTGSGKSFTMMGEGVDGGVIQRSIAQIFKVANELQEQGRTSEFDGQFLEVLGNNIFDLMPDYDSSSTARPTSGSSALPAHWTTLTTFDQAMKVFKTAKKRRHVENTVWNKGSSRSHFILRLRMKTKEGGGAQSGMLTLVDLAGNEHWSGEDERVREMQTINHDLFTFGHVITALQKTERVPYRNSKLTQLLEPSFGRHSSTIFLLHISPVSARLSQSSNALDLGTEISSISLVNQC